MANKGDMHYDVWAAFALLRRVTRPAVVVLDGLERAEQPVGRSAIVDSLITPPDPRVVLTDLLRTDGGGRAGPVARRGALPAPDLPQRRSKPTLLPDPNRSAATARPFEKRDFKAIDKEKTQSTARATPTATRRILKAADHKPMTLKQVADTRLSRRRASLKQTSEGDMAGASARRDPHDRVIPMSKKLVASSAKPPAQPVRHPLEQLAAQSKRTRSFDVSDKARKDAADLEAGTLSHTTKGKGPDGFAPDRVKKAAIPPDRVKKTDAQNERPKPMLSNITAAPSSVHSNPSKSRMKATAPDRLNVKSPRLDDEQQALEEEAWRNGVFER